MPVQGSTGITVQTVMRFLLSLSLLVAFTTSAAAALCLQMEQHDPASMTEPTSAMALRGHIDDTMMIMVSGPKGSPSAHACCHQQADTPEAVTPPQRAVPAEPNGALSVSAGRLPIDHVSVPPGLFDPALEKRDHLAPSLTELSISRT